MSFIIEFIYRAACFYEGFNIFKDFCLFVCLFYFGMAFKFSLFYNEQLNVMTGRR